MAQGLWLESHSSKGPNAGKTTHKSSTPDFLTERSEGFKNFNTVECGLVHFPQRKVHSLLSQVHSIILELADLTGLDPKNRGQGAT
jgi:hypothetical protein